MGHPGKFSYCIAEDEESTEWNPLAEEKGIPHDVSAVTVTAGAPRQLMNEWTTEPEELETFAAEIRANMRTTLSGCNYAIIVPPQLRAHLHAAGWSRADVANHLFERARIHRREWGDAGKGAVVRDRGDTEYAAMESPDQLMIIAAGGYVGGFGAVIPPWLGHKSHAVTTHRGMRRLRDYPGGSVRKRTTHELRRQQL